MMNLNTIFEKEYENLCSDSFDPTENEIIRVVDDSITIPQLDKVIYINLENKNVNELSLIPIVKTLHKVAFHILSLDMSFNSLFNDSCVGYLEGLIKACPNIAYIALEKVSMTDQGAISLINCLCNTSSIRSIKMGSNKLSEKVAEKFTAAFKKGKLLSLESLNLSNIKMSERSAIALLTSVVEYSQIVSLNLSNNCLKYKTGAHLINLLSVNINAPLMHVDLSYNPIGKPLLKTIEEELQKRQVNGIWEDNATLNHTELESIEPIGEMPEETEDMDSDIEQPPNPYKEEKVNVLNERKENSSLREIKQKEQSDIIASIKEDAKGSEELASGENSPAGKKTLKGILNVKSKGNNVNDFQLNKIKIEATCKEAINNEYPTNDYKYKRRSNKEDHKYEEDSVQTYKEVYEENDKEESECSINKNENKWEEQKSSESKRINSVEEAKNIIRQHMSKLLEFYSNLEEPFNLSDDTIELAKKLIKETPIPKLTEASAIELEVIKSSTKLRPRFIKKACGNNIGGVKTHTKLY